MVEASTGSVVWRGWRAKAKAMDKNRKLRFLELDEALWKYLGSLPASEVEQASPELCRFFACKNRFFSEVNLARPPQINKGEDET